MIDKYRKFGWRIFFQGERTLSGYIQEIEKVHRCIYVLDRNVDQGLYSESKNEKKNVFKSKILHGCNNQSTVYEKVFPVSGIQVDYQHLTGRGQ